ncbi:helix-turn-helix domain-containing protein [Mucilaginibacter arboris]|uniref:Helix-turn-helix domain-containing protein n=1 Tax=Mucilaginibacter arboris TaxID=2682090 RepID=A0A7K1SUS1_9SPHI|nr:helix-turn-helix domain-containing protein [Mucilaginibacter arboris]MVN21089.1 helix-turn-helix domain-containing protein [Mucilaginibacter arboris]
MKSNIAKEEIKNRLQSLKISKTEEQLIERDSLILQANYLSEIERISKENGFNRKDLAIKIKTSPSYLTQVFRGDKPLNFLTLAKIKRALNLKFEVKAELIAEQKTQIISDFSILSSIKENNLTTININVIQQYSSQKESVVMEDFIPINYKDVQTPSYEMTLQKFQITKQIA